MGHRTLAGFRQLVFSFSELILMQFMAILAIINSVYEYIEVRNRRNGGGK